MDTPISIDAETGRPWRHRFDAKTLLHEERMLQAAAYIVCAYLTGMRDCEVQAMRSGCLSLARSEDGLIMRHRVRSVAYKGKQSVGEPAQWITIAPVAEAIQVLERLSARVATARSADTLWPVLVVKAGCKDHISAEIVRQLNAYRDHLNASFGTKDAPVIPTGPDGLPWRITTRQFRRTIAWHIANRPFGTIAGMIQYKHASVAAFEGYAGSSRSGFRAEVEAQRVLGQLDDILTYFDEHRAGTPLSGPAGPRIAKTMAAAAGELGPLPAISQTARGCARCSRVWPAHCMAASWPIASSIPRPRSASSTWVHPTMQRRCSRSASRPAVPTPASPNAIGRSGRGPPRTPGRCCARSACPCCNAWRYVVTSTASKPFSRESRHRRAPIRRLSPLRPDRT
jgi:hypothetical protein